MRYTTTAAALLLLATAGAAFADDDCNVPMADWQPRDVLRQKLEQQGWEVQRIKVDDGCYKVRGIDGEGNKVKAKYAPDSLRILKLETTYSYDDGRAGADNKRDAKDKEPDQRPRARIE